MDEPVISRWATPCPKILRTLKEVNELLHVNGPFYPFSDALSLQTAELLRDAGLPWHNNNLNHPDEFDPSWPFHLKILRNRQYCPKGPKLVMKRHRITFCPWTEGNHYAIQALQQELHRQRPSQKPLLVAGTCRSQVQW